ncbi:hypothetical protein MVEG_00096 [Podila verticillata NRRL 6337]|nr:hypothetical protein MVEG_00096 [Podila verticillata NRRL 6337]
MTIERPKTTHSPNTTDDAFFVHDDVLSVGADSNQVIVDSQVTLLDVDSLYTFSSATAISNTSSFLDHDEDEGVDETALNESDGINSHLEAASNTVKEKRYSKKTCKNYSYYLNAAKRFAKEQGYSNDFDTINRDIPKLVTAFVASKCDPQTDSGKKPVSCKTAEAI